MPEPEHAAQPPASQAGPDGLRSEPQAGAAEAARAKASADSAASADAEGAAYTEGAEGAIGRTLADIGEDELLAQIFPLLPAADALIGPGDDAAVIRGDGSLVLTTDTMMRGQDWLDDWSTAADVGAKCVAQNLADVAAMGARPMGLLVTLIADPATRVDWALDLSAGIGAAAAAAGTGVLGGDLSSADPGVLGVSVVALGRLGSAPAVTRSGARPGDVVAVAGTLGRAAAGLELFLSGAWVHATGPAAELLAAQRRPSPPLAAGPQAAAAGARAMIDLSDGLARDAGRVARASGVVLALDGAALAGDIEALAPHVGADAASRCVLAGGEEHSLLACFPPQVDLPAGWRALGRVREAGPEGPGVLVDGRPPRELGWDHFGG